MGSTFGTHDLGLSPVEPIASGWVGLVEPAADPETGGNRFRPI
jgi:hypothetical protein